MSGVGPVLRGAMFSWLFRPDIDALVAKADYDGLVALLGHREADLRARAADALVALPGASTALIVALKQGVAGAARVLARRGEGTEALVAALAHPEMAVHQEARAALVQLRAVDPLRVVAASDPSAQARGLALRALGEIKPVDLAEILSHALGDRAGDVRSIAVSLGGRPGGLSPEPAARRSAIDAISRSPRVEDAAMLLEVLERGDEQSRVYAVGGLARLGQFDAICGALRDRSPSVRAEAARGLGGSARFGSQLVASLSDPDAMVRGAVALALGRTGDQQWLPRLITALDAGNAYAARALGQLGDRAAVQPLIRALDRADTADLAAEALGVLGDPAAIGPLNALVKRSRRDPSTRQDDPDAADMAREALVKLGASR